VNVADIPQFIMWEQSSNSEIERGSYNSHIVYVNGSNKIASIRKKNQKKKMENTLVTNVQNSDRIEHAWHPPFTCFIPTHTWHGNRDIKSDPQDSLYMHTRKDKKATIMAIKKPLSLSSLSQTKATNESNSHYNKGIIITITSFLTFLPFSYSQQ